eukprot:11166626-Lingulodinium_polyedra.AAC.1
MDWSRLRRIGLAVRRIGIRLSSSQLRKLVVVGGKLLVCRFNGVDIGPQATASVPKVVAPAQKSGTLE